MFVACSFCSLFVTFSSSAAFLAASAASSAKAAAGASATAPATLNELLRKSARPVLAQCSGVVGLGVREVLVLIVAANGGGGIGIGIIVIVSVNSTKQQATVATIGRRGARSMGALFLSLPSSLPPSRSLPVLSPGRGLGRSNRRGERGRAGDHGEEKNDAGEHGVYVYVGVCWAGGVRTRAGE